MQQLLIWLPRIIAIIYGMVIAFFAFYAFAEEASLGQQIRSFLNHLIPVFLVAISLAVAWRYQIFGGLLFIVLGQIFAIYFGTHHSTTRFLLVSFPLIAAGAVFILSHKQPGK